MFPFDSKSFERQYKVAVGFRAGRTDEPRQGRKTATVLLCVGAAECLAALLVFLFFNVETIVFMTFEKAPRFLESEIALSHISDKFFRTL